MTCLTPKILAKLTAGSLEGAARAESETHLEGCASCRERRDELAGALALLGKPGLEAGEPEPAPGTWAAVQAELARDAERTSLARVAIGCAYCKGGLVRAESVYCAACLAPHHEDCFADHGRCAACAATTLVRAERIRAVRPPRPGRARKLALAASSLVLLGGAAAFGSRPVATYLRREFLALWADAETKRKAEWTALDAEVARLTAEARACLESAVARKKDRDAVGAIADAARGLVALAQLEGVPRRFQDYHTPAEVEEATRKLTETRRTLERELVQVQVDASELLGTPESYEEALRAARRAVELGAGSAGKIRVARLLRLLGRSNEALATLDAVVAGEPGNAPALVARAELREERGDPERALADWNAAIEHDPSPASHLGRGQLLFSLHLFDRAKADFELALERGDSWTGFLWRGRARQELGDAAGARDDLTEAIDLQPAFPDGYYWRGRLSLAERKLAEAIKDFEVAITRNGQFYAAYLGLGEALELSLDSDRAQAQYEELIQAPDARPQEQAVAFARKASLVVRRGEPCEVACELLSPPRPEDRGSPARLAVQVREARAKRLEQARALLDQAAKLDPTVAAVAVARARLALERDDRAAAKKELQAAREALSSSAWRRARVALEPARANDPDPEVALVEAWLGRVALASKDVLDAARRFEAACRASPGSAFAHAGRGLADLAADGAQAANDLDLAWNQAAVGSTREVPETDLAFLVAEARRWAQNARRSLKPEALANACEAYGLALEANPYDAVSRVERARLLAEWDRPELALEDADAAIAVCPLRAEPHVVRGFLFGRDLPEAKDGALPGAAREPATAVRELGAALALTKDPAVQQEAHYGIAVALAPREPARALESVDRALALDGPWGRTAEEGARWFDQASVETVQRVLAIAELDFRLRGERSDGLAAAQSRERLADVRRGAREASHRALEAGRVLRDHRNYTDAIERFDRAVALDPENADAFYDRGTCYLKIGNFVPGILDFSKALELNPRFSDQFYNKVYQVSYVVDLNRVITELNKIVADHPRQAHVIFLRGFFYVAKTEFKKYDQKDLDAGIKDFDETLALNPRFVTAWIYRAFLKDKSARIAPGETRAKAFDAALADYDRAKQLDPEGGIAYFLSAMVWSQRAAEPGIPDSQRRACVDRSVADLKVSIDEKAFKGFDRIKSEKGFDAVRDDPRVLELIRGK